MINYEWVRANCRDWQTINLIIALNTMRRREYDCNPGIWFPEPTKDAVDAIEEILTERGVHFRPIPRRRSWLKPSP